MKKLFNTLLIPIVIACTVFVVAFIVRPLLLKDKILFPSNLLVSTYSPWKYEPPPDYPNGPSNKPMGFDNIRQYYPIRKFLAEELKKGSIPLWNPYIYSGAPFMATFDTTMWYPLTWIANLFSIVDGWNFLVLVQPVLSFLFMYLFLRSLPLTKKISLFGAFIYTFSGWMIVYWQEVLVVLHSFLWLPLALYASNRLWSRSFDTVSWGVLVGALVCSIFGGFFQMSLYVYGTVVLWNIYKYFSVPKNERKKSLGAVVSAILVSLACSSIQLIPTIEAFRIAPRGVGDGIFIFRDFLLPIQHLITFIAPDFWGNPATYNYFGGKGFYFEKMLFIGIIPLIFSLYAIISVKDRKILFWKIFAIVTISMGFALPTSWLPNILHIPVLSNSYPTRIFSLSLLSLCVLSCYGLQIFLQKPNYKNMIRILAMMTFFLTSAWSVVTSSWCITHSYPQNILVCKGKISVLWDFLNIPSIRNNAMMYASVSLRNLIIPSIFLLLTWGIVGISKISMKVLFIGVCILSILSSFYFAKKYVYFGERRFLFPDLAVTNKISEISGYDRIWGFGNAFIETNVPLYYRWFSTDGYSGLSSTRYAEFLSTIVNEGKINMVRRSDSDLYQTSERDSFSSNNPYRLKIMELLGVKYILESKKGELKESNTTENRFSSELFNTVWEDQTWRLWQYKKAMPRVFFAPSYIVENHGQKIIDLFYSSDINLSDTVILEKEPVKQTNINQFVQSDKKSKVEITSYRPNEVTIHSDLDDNGFVVLTDNYYPGWQAYVDGKKTEIYRTDYSFRSVFVSKGIHGIVFRYQPLSVYIGGAISIIGIWVCSIIIFRKKYPKLP